MNKSQIGQKAEKFADEMDIDLESLHDLNQIDIVIAEIPDLEFWCQVVEVGGMERKLQAVTRLDTYKVILREDIARHEFMNDDMGWNFFSMLEDIEEINDEAIMLKSKFENLI